MGSENKYLQENSFIMDINLIEVPFFLFKNPKKSKSVKELKQDKEVSSEVKNVLKLVLPKNENSTVEYIKWIDSKGMNRELFAMSLMALPNGFCMDVWYALIALYIKKNSPVLFNKAENIYDLKDFKVEFTYYELAKFMNLATNGNNIERIKIALIQLNEASYYSFKNGSVYDKQNERYIQSKLKGIRLISELEMENREKDVKGSKRSSKCTVTFSTLIVENIKREFIKYLNKDTYFKLPSGLSRRLYTYIEANKYKKGGKLNEYIKRSYAVIARKLPVEFKYASEFKRRINKPLENLKQIGLIEDYFFGDDILINGVKENCIYIIFTGSKETIIENLIVKNNPIVTENKKEEIKLELPKDIKQELIDLGINNEKVNEIIKKYNKWTLIEYILWVKEKVKESNNNLKNIAGLLIYALQTQNVKLQNTYQYILDFVKEEKLKLELKQLSDDEIKAKYDKYIENEIKKFKEEDEFLYDFIKNNIYDNICEVIDKKIAQRNITIINCEDKKAKSEFIKQLTELKEIKEKGLNAEEFKIRFIREIMIMRELKDFNTFKLNLLKKHTNK